VQLTLAFLLKQLVTVLDYCRLFITLWPFLLCATTNLFREMNGLWNCHCKVIPVGFANWRPLQPLKPGLKQWC